MWVILLFLPALTIKFCSTDIGACSVFHLRPSISDHRNYLHRRIPDDHNFAFNLNFHGVLQLIGNVNRSEARDPF
ncbi:hypothetical protein M378DRAFT_976133 [Amanita muscaria Koide BX008]|uniref:Secreted protein n=1 Tax=Amanita muscaria (strain Koide BX008) TaxID=946122 RepID=A0A0C2TL10_AMAMK|nr:hypothetical protein M378DRAFT_976133 [Amanita muscaria Koide BX008]